MVRESLLHESGGSGAGGRDWPVRCAAAESQGRAANRARDRAGPRPGPPAPPPRLCWPLLSPCLEDPALTDEILVQPGSEFLLSPIVSFLTLRTCSGYARCYLWGKLGEGYTGTLCAIFTISLTL